MLIGDFYRITVIRIYKHIAVGGVVVKKKKDELRPRPLGGLGLPYGIIRNSVHIEINGNREAVIDGSSGILEYNENCIRISVQKMIVAFHGRGLLIRCLSENSMVIEGYINAVEYVC